MAIITALLFKRRTLPLLFSLPYYKTSTAPMSSLSPSPFKRAKTSLSSLPPSTKTIGTHSGTFQADEALGCWLLRQTSTYRNSPVVRSRDPAILDQCDIVIDVGGIYNHDRLRYDHHQRDYNEKFTPKINNDGSTSERCTKLSASGLVYRHYGKAVIKEYYPDLSDELLELAYEKMYDSFMEAIDAIDTGVEPIPATATTTTGLDVPIISLVYSDSTGLSSRVSRCNPRWNEVDEMTNQPPNPDERFEIASQMCGDDFMSVLTKIVEADLPARSIVEQAVKDRFDVDASGEIICLPSGGLPWKSEVYELEHQYKIDPLIKYVLYTDQSGMWRIQCVSVEGKAFENRLGLPKEWRGVRDADLEKIAGITGCTFCHAAGFIGGNKSYEGALEMARVALKKGRD